MCQQCLVIFFAASGAGAAGVVLAAGSLVVVAVCTQDQVAVGEEAGANQRHGATRALKARLVPLPVLKRNVLPVSKTCERHTRTPHEQPIKECFTRGGK